ncbi:hypothetical protein [Asticcacaulis machinosus]|uniref:REDY-like protein HapK n=1 Tax=Asticcacaulis machinosus TaxID=2984211 RepID=A0ABT5HFB2_9CAUL|nr:hypothetical protein [Asticcacaulis machinosus]MDC7674693.1 hypothetical protein [Asticcacaulis machinosus]
MGSSATNQLAWVIDFRVLARGDGQPNFLEAFQCLNRRIGAQAQWHALSDLPDFTTIRTASGQIYAMEVLVEARVIDLLKWQDIEENHLRVLDERLATEAEAAVLFGSAALDNVKGSVT